MKCAEVMQAELWSLVSYHSSVSEALMGRHKCKTLFISGIHNSLQSVQAASEITILIVTYDTAHVASSTKSILEGDSQSAVTLADFSS